MASPDETNPIASLDPPAYRSGDLVARRYRIDGLLAREGTADVYAATDLGLRRPVALKIASAATSVASDRLLHEARTLAVLRHPNIIGVHDCGRTVRGTAFIALERSSGPTLREFLAQNAPLTWQTATAMAMQIASGLEAAHARGIVHCDLSSSNVLLAQSERGPLTCKLANPGVARQTETDARLDLHALGVILAEMLESVAQGAPSALTSLTSSLTSADPESRPSSASTVLAALRQIAASDTSASLRSRTPVPIPAPSPLAWSVVGVALLVSAGALISSVGMSKARSSAVVGEPRTPPPPPVRAELQEFPAQVKTPELEETVRNGRPQRLND